MAAQFKFDQAGLGAGAAGFSRTDGLITGALVTITRTAGGDPASCYLRYVPPEDDVAVGSLAHPTADTWTFTPKAGVWGKYLIELVTDEGTAQESRLRLTFGIRSPVAGLLRLAANETADRSAHLQNITADLIARSNSNEPHGPYGGGDPFGWLRDIDELIAYVETISAGGGTAKALAPRIVVGNAVAGDNLADCDYLDAGDCVQLKAALDAAALLTDVFVHHGVDIYVREGFYSLTAETSPEGPLVIPSRCTLRGSGWGPGEDGDQFVTSAPHFYQALTATGNDPGVFHLELYAQLENVAVNLAANTVAGSTASIVLTGGNRLKNVFVTEGDNELTVAGSVRAIVEAYGAASHYYTNFLENVTLKHPGIWGGYPEDLVALKVVSGTLVATNLRTMNTDVGIQCTGGRIQAQGLLLSGHGRAAVEITSENASECHFENGSITVRRGGDAGLADAYGVLITAPDGETIRGTLLAGITFPEPTGSNNDAHPIYLDGSGSGAGVTDSRVVGCYFNEQGGAVAIEATSGADRNVAIGCTFADAGVVPYADAGRDNLFGCHIQTTPLPIVVDVEAGSDFVELPFHIADTLSRVRSIKYVPEVAAAGNDTHNMVLHVQKRDGIGGAPVTVASYTNDVASGGLAAMEPKDLGAPTNAQMAENNVLTFEKTENGNGQDLPRGTLVVELVRE